MRILLASTSSLALPTFEAIRSTEHELIGLVIKAERPSGRGQGKHENELARRLGAEGLEVYRVSSHDELAGLLTDLSVDLVIAISFGMLIKRDSLEIPRFGWINLHFSLLPRYRGAAPVQRAILAGEEVTGVSVFKLDSGMDTGPIYRQASLQIAGQNAGEVLNSLANLGSSEVVATLNLIEAGEQPTPQSGTSSLAPKINSSETRIDFSEKAIEASRKIAAFAPSPGAWCELGGKRIKLLAAKVTSLVGKPGSCLSVDPLIIATGEESLEILEMQEAGKRRMTSTEWVRGSKIEIGARFL